MHRRRGNLIVSALFMAGFLFFLSVALVVTNRQDIRYTLFVDHKLRADLAAEGILDRSLSLMRNTSGWEGTITEKIQFASGATGSCSYQPWIAPGVQGDRYTAPVIAAPVSAIELVARGVSGPFASERHVLLEEFRFADSIATEGGKPHLFAVTGNALQVLTPAFAWEAAGSMDGNFILKTVATGGGPLRYLSSGQGQQPPNLTDYTKEIITGMPFPGPSASVQGDMQFQRGHGGATLKLETEKWAWENLPSPGIQLQGTPLQPEPQPDSSESLEARSGGVGWDSMQLSWDMLGSAPPGMVLDFSFFSGPRANWYSLTGTAADAGSDAYYCHGRHYFYSGYRFKLSRTERGLRSQGKDQQLYSQPCILKLQGDRWTPVLDLLKVGDYLLEPEVQPGLRPDPNTMLVSPEGKVYTKALEQPANKWFEVRDNKLVPSTLPEEPEMRFYGSRPIFPKLRDPRYTEMALNQHDIAPYMPGALPVVNPQVSMESSQQTVQYEAPFNVTWDVRFDTFTSARNDFFVVVNLKGGKSGLGHFDGTRWQLLPGGLSLMLPESSSFTQELRWSYGGGMGPASGAQRLLLAGYQTQRPLLRRYVPIARWGD